MDSPPGRMRAARVVPMQMRQDHGGDLFRADAHRFQRTMKLKAAVVDAIDVRELLRELRAAIVIDQDFPAVADQQQRLRGQFDPVVSIGGIGYLPQRFRHRPEHRPPSSPKRHVSMG